MTANDRPHDDGPSTEMVLRALDTEIEHLERAATRPGWTLWALLGTLAGLTWLVLATVDGRGLQVAATGPFILTTVLAIDLADFLLLVLRAGPSGNRLGTRYFFTSALGADRPLFAYLAVRDVWLLWLALHFGGF